MRLRVTTMRQRLVLVLVLELVLGGVVELAFGRFLSRATARIIKMTMMMMMMMMTMMITKRVEMLLAAMRKRRRKTSTRERNSPTVRCTIAGVV